MAPRGLPTAVWRRAALAAAIVAAIAIAIVQSQSPEAPFYDYRSQAPGTVHYITPADLPAPGLPAANARVPYTPGEQWPQVPDGFVVDRYASDLNQPRIIRRAPNGDLFVVESAAGRVTTLRDVPGAEPRREVFASGLASPSGVAFYPPSDPFYVYVATISSIVRFRYANGDMRARGEPDVVIPKLLALDTGGHWTRDIAFSLDERTLYVAIGSASNVDDADNNPAEEHRAAILETGPEGGPLSVFASGLRNPSSIAIDPLTGGLWAVVNERDLLGDNLPPDYVTSVRRGGFYGWPWFYIGGNQDPRLPGKHPELKHQVMVPDVLLQPHSAPLSLTFYDGAQFGRRFVDNVFVVSHGSWNRSVPTGYAVLRVSRNDGLATGAYEDFVTGFVAPDGTVRGRPAGVAVAADGLLMVADELASVIWRVRTAAAAAAANARRGL